MRKMGLVLALLSTVAMTVVPVAPSYAAAPAAAPTNETVAKYAASGDIVVLSPAQMNQLAASHPKLHAKLDAAHKAGSVPRLSKAEKQLVRTLTAQNMADIKAGHWAAGWVIVAIAAGVLLLLFIATPIGCGLFPWAPACGRPVVARN